MIDEDTVKQLEEELLAAEQVPEAAYLSQHDFFDDNLVQYRLTAMPISQVLQQAETDAKKLQEKVP